MQVIETDRLVLRWATESDAAFVLDLVTEPSWKKFIGDSGVKTLTGAREYIRDKLIASYYEHGFGLYIVEQKSDGQPVDICGLVKRETLNDVDIGFAFKQAHWSQGFGFESANGVMTFCQENLGLDRLVAITAPDNQPSIRLLQKLGLNYEKTMKLDQSKPEVKLFSKIL